VQKPEKLLTLTYHGRFLSGMENELLHPPVQYFGDIELVFRWTGLLVNPTELFELLAGLAEYAQKFAVQSQFVNASRIRIRHCTALGGPGVMQIAQGAPGACVPLTSSGGLLPIAARAVLRSNGTSILISRRNLPSPSNT